MVVGWIAHWYHLVAMVAAVSLVAHSSSMQAGPGLEEFDAMVEGVPLWVVAMVLLLVVVPKEASPSAEVVSMGSHLGPAMEAGEAMVVLTSGVGAPLPGSMVEVQRVARQQPVHWAVAAAAAMDPLQRQDTSQRHKKN